MEATEIVEATAAHIEQAMTADSAHDWWHVRRVWKMAVELARIEGADLLTVELAALLHDLADWKFHGGDETAAPRAAREWLASFDLPAATVDHVCQIVGQLSYKGAGVATPMSTLEGAVVQDADRLDAIGAIGVARAFAYGGHKDRLLYDPGIPPEMHTSFQAYKKSTNPTINHFYEKLLLLSDRLNTPAARRIASERHQFMRQFLEQFFREWHVGEEPPAWTEIP